MRDSVPRIFIGLVLGLGLALAACGGGEPQRRDPSWRASERVPNVAEHWWWEPVERACEEDSDCRQGETCRTMRLGTCTSCPRGEQARICVGGQEPANRRATRR